MYEISSITRKLLVLALLFTARRYASILHAITMCLSLCLYLTDYICHKLVLYQSGYVQDHAKNAIR